MGRAIALRGSARGSLLTPVAFPALAVLAGASGLWKQGRTDLKFV